MHERPPGTVHVSRKRAVLLCVLAFAAIVVLDWTASPAIPLGLYLVLPVAASAWYLDKPITAALVVGSSIVRTVALTRDFHFPAGETLVHAANFCSSLLLFSGAAVLLIRLRDAHVRLAAQAVELRLLASRAEERLRFEWSIRRAVPTDVEGLIALCVVGARTGDLSKEVLDAVHRQVMQATYANLIQQGQGGRRTWSATAATVPVEFWIAQIDGVLAGFFMVMGLDDKRGSERELHAIVTAEDFRGRGLGSAMLDFFCAHYVGRRLFAACRPGGQMHKMFLRRGFTQYATSDEGLVIVHRQDWAAAIKAAMPAPTPTEERH